MPESNRLMAPVPSPPFIIRTPKQTCFRGVTEERQAASLAIRLVRRGAQLIETVDSDGWVFGIYERAL